MMLGFMVLLVGFFYVNATDTQKMDENHTQISTDYVAVNM